MPSPVYWNAIYQTSLKTKKLYNTVLSKEWNYFNSGNMKSIFLKDDWVKKAEYIANKLLDNNYFNRIENKVKKETQKITNFLKKEKNIDFSKLSFKELIKLANKIEKICLDYDTANVLAWFLAGDSFQEKIYNRLKISKEDFLVLVTPKERTAVSELEYKLLKYALNKKDLERAAKELSEDYGWIPFGYDGPEYWGKDYFIKELRKKIGNEGVKAFVLPLEEMT